MKAARIIFPHQLFEHHPLLTHPGTIYLIEESLFFNQYAFHLQKIAFHRATMKYYAHYLSGLDQPVQYIEAKEPEADVRTLLSRLKRTGCTAIAITDPVDDWLLKRIRRACSQYDMALTILETPMFLNTTQELQTFFTPSKKKFFQTEFYKQERIKRKILTDEAGGPVGGKWSFDDDNRKKYPKGKAMVRIEFPAPDQFSKEGQRYAQQDFADNPGKLNEMMHYPIGFEASMQWLDDFLRDRFPAFGDYEDAIVQKELVLHHSLLTPLLNTGMLTPRQVIDHTLAHANTHKIPLNSLEGFIRQIIGWREFIRGVYVAKGRQERTRNFWGFTRKMPVGFYTASTGILPVDITIRKVLDTGYCHHIERLMVLGNFMLLCEIDPDEVYRWFMELFIDAYDWVMVPNVYGMSQFADGGLMSTKPYISGSNYLMKMSDYPKGDWQETWDALFWRFLDKHRVFFLKNPRLGMLVKTYDKWDAEKKYSIHQRSEEFLAGLDL